MGRQPPPQTWKKAEMAMLPSVSCASAGDQEWGRGVDGQGRGRGARGQCRGAAGAQPHSCKAWAGTGNPSGPLTDCSDGEGIGKQAGVGAVGPLGGNGCLLGVVPACSHSGVGAQEQLPSRCRLFKSVRRLRPPLTRRHQARYTSFHQGGNLAHPPHPSTLSNPPNEHNYRTSPTHLP